MPFYLFLLLLFYHIITVSLLLRLTFKKDKAINIANEAAEMYRYRVVRADFLNDKLMAQNRALNEAIEEQLFEIGT